jgi:tRNA U38,U39,U40 pseudouridine synthase TruA
MVGCVCYEKKYVMSEYDKRIETVLDVLLVKANKQDVELLVESTFEGDEREDLSVMVHNTERNKFGIIAVNVEDFKDDLICFFSFNSKLYEYCVQEGFDREHMLTGFNNKVFKKLKAKEFFDFILDGYDEELRK